MSPAPRMPAAVCPLCRAPLVAVRGALRCGRCGEYPRVGGVAVLAPQPAPLLRHAWDGVVHGAARLRLRRAEAARARSLSKEDSASTVRTLAAMETNHALLEGLVGPRVAAATSAGGFADPWVAAPRWSFRDVLPYFFEDWGGARAAFRARALAAARRHPGRRRAALVVGCGASALVGDLAATFDSSYGADLSLAPLLLARRLLDGERARCHLETAGWRRIVLRGRAGAAKNAHLVVADATRLPFANESFDVVVTQYLLDLLPDPAAAIREVNRVLAPGGVWIHDGLPFKLQGEPHALPRRTSELPAVAAGLGFECLGASRRSVVHPDLRGLDPWTSRVVHRVVHAVSRKASAALDPFGSAVTAYFGGDRGPLLALVATLAEPDEIWPTYREARGRVVERALRLGDAEYAMPDEPSLRRALAFVHTLARGTPVGAVARTLGRTRWGVSERDVVLAVSALARAGLVDLRP